MALNKQKEHGIEWTHVFGPDTGYTWNPITGCKHDCQWEVAGQMVECYAKVFHERQWGDFTNIVYHPDRLADLKHLKNPSGIFADSMSDMFGREVKDEYIQAILEEVAKYPQHVILTLTKNPPRLKKFKFPPNLWVGVSAPPTKMYGNILSSKQQVRFAQISLEVLAEIEATVKWMSIEPLSWDIAPIIKAANNPLDWMVLGAATTGRKVYTPNWRHVQNVLDVAHHYGTPVFFKGNMRGNRAADPWREEFPKTRTLEEWFPPEMRVMPPTKQDKLL